MELSDCNYAILRRNRARCAVNKKILNLLNGESVSGESSGRASESINQREVLPQMFEKVSRSLKYDSIFLVHRHINIYIPMDTNTID